MPQKHKTDQRDEQVADMLHHIYETYKGGGALGSRGGLSRLLNDAARSKSINTEGKTKVQLYGELAGVLTDSERTTIFESVQRNWVLSGGERAQQTGLSPEQEETAATLRRMYEGRRTFENTVSNSLRNRTTRSLKALSVFVRAHVPGVPLWHPTDNAGSLYLSACRALAGGHSGNGPLRLADYLRMVEYQAEQVRAWWKEFIEPHAAKHAAKAEAPGRSRKRRGARAAETYDLTLTETIPHLGLIKGDVVQAAAATNIKVWEIASLWRPGAAASKIGRVTAIDADSITLRLATAERTYSLTELEFLGRVNPEPVGRHDGLSDEQRDRLRELRRRLDKVDADDITSSTSLLKLEREIYDIEHPTGTKDSNDWSAWEGE